MAEPGHSAGARSRETLSEKAKRVTAPERDLAGIYAQIDVPESHELDNCLKACKLPASQLFRRHLHFTPDCGAARRVSGSSDISAGCRLLRRGNLALRSSFCEVLRYRKNGKMCDRAQRVVRVATKSITRSAQRTFEVFPSLHSSNSRRIRASSYFLCPPMIHHLTYRM
jgi:hypothetical protein